MKLSDVLRERTRPFYSLEFFPPKDPEQFPAFIKTAARLKELDPLFVSVTYGAGGGSQYNTVEVSRRLKVECGYEPMPHLTCVGATCERIDEYLGELASIGVGNVLALRGDAPKPQSPDEPPFDWAAGRFRYASDLVEYVCKAFPEFGVAVAGYPAPHPESATFDDDRVFTGRKLEAGAGFVVTQLFFDVREYIDLTERLRAMGCNKPVIPGVLPIQSFESLRHVLSLCGANIPAKLYIALEEANKKGGVEAVREAGQKFAVEQIRRLIDAGAPGIHLYTLNKAETCLSIAEAVGQL